MSSIEKINEIKKSLEEMKEAKKGIKESLENKFGKKIGDDITKYPQMINKVWTENSKIDVGETATGLFSTYQTFNSRIWDFSNTTNFYRMLYNSTPPDDELEDKIEINFRNAKNYTDVFRLYSSTNSYDSRKHFKVVGLPTDQNNITSFLNGMYGYLDNMKVLDDIIYIDEEIDLKGKTFSCEKIWEYCDTSVMKHLPNWFCKIIPYVSTLSNTNSKSIELEEDMNLEFCKEKKLVNNAWAGTFGNITAPNIHFYLYHDLEMATGYSIFLNGACAGKIRIDGPGCLIFTASRNSDYDNISRIAYRNFTGNELEAKFKINSRVNQDFWNFKKVTFLEGTEFYSVSNLPYTTREEWIEFFNTLPDNSTSTYSNTIKINSEYYNLLTEEDILISTEKGYIITSV